MLLLLFGAALVGVGALGLLAAEEWIHWIGGLIAVGIGITALMDVWLRLRYWVALNRNYGIDNRGITISAGETTTMVGWDKCRSAVYFPLFSLYRLEVDELDPPIIIFSDRGILASRNRYVESETAENLIREKMRERLRKRLVPIP